MLSLIRFSLFLINFFFLKEYERYNFLYFLHISNWNTNFYPLKQTHFFDILHVSRFLYVKHFTWLYWLYYCYCCCCCCCCCCWSLWDLGYNVVLFFRYMMLLLFSFVFVLLRWNIHYCWFCNDFYFIFERYIILWIVVGWK